MVAIRHEIGQQATALQRRAFVADHHAGPVRLLRHRAAAAQQMRMQGLADHARRVGAQKAGIHFELVTGQRQLVQTLAGQRRQCCCRLQVGQQRDPDRRASGGREIAAHAGQEGVGIGKALEVERIEIELHGFGFDKAGRLRRHDDFRHAHPRLALRVQPRHLVMRPQVRAAERRRSGNAEGGAPRRARDRKQQFGRVALRIFRDLPQQRLVLAHAPYSRNPVPRSSRRSENRNSPAQSSVIMPSENQMLTSLTPRMPKRKAFTM